MNGANPDPSEPPREGDAIARLQLTQALQRAKYAIAWERAWPHLARLLTVVGLFLVVSWAGLWLALPFVAHGNKGRKWPCYAHHLSCATVAIVCVIIR